MAKLTREDILKLARLSRLKLSDSEVTKFQHELSEILGYFEILQQADTNGLKPTNQVTGLVNAMRPDDIIDYGISQEGLLKNVSHTHQGYIKTKRILG